MSPMVLLVLLLLICMKKPVTSSVEDSTWGPQGYKRDKRLWGGGTYPLPGSVNEDYLSYTVSTILQ